MDRKFMKEKEQHETTEIARRAAKKAGQKALERFREEFETETKDDKTDYVTTADHEAQEAALAVLHDSFPDDGVVAEEGDGIKTVPEEGRFWIIDPIDGTANFVHGTPVWASSVALVIDGEPVASANYMPALGDMYVAGEETRLNGERVGVSEVTDHEVFKIVPTVWWEHNRRDEFAEVSRRVVTGFGDLLRVGSAQTALSMLASGALEGVVTNVNVNPWDSVAGVHMVRCGGGTVTGADGKRWTTNSEGLVASNGKEHEAVLETVSGL
jgi:myo-inositol-1(or 4)-monophosphatase